MSDLITSLPFLGILAVPTGVLLGIFYWVIRPAVMEILEVARLRLADRLALYLASAGAWLLPDAGQRQLRLEEFAGLYGGTSDLNAHQRLVQALGIVGYGVKSARISELWSRSADFRRARATALGRFGSATESIQLRLGLSILMMGAGFYAGFNRFAEFGSAAAAGAGVLAASGAVGLLHVFRFLREGSRRAALNVELLSINRAAFDRVGIRLESASAARVYDVLDDGWKTRSEIAEDCGVTGRALTLALTELGDEIESGVQAGVRVWARKPPLD